MKLEIELKIKVKTVKKKGKFGRRLEELGLEYLRKLGFSDGAILLIDKLEEMFRKHPEGFDRHCEDRLDQQNLDGECWTIELDMDKGTFKKYFRQIGVVYNSPQKFLEAEDKFGGKYYCSVLDSSNHSRTRYYRNHDLAQGMREAVADNFSGNSNNLDMGVKA